jgi:hypothetical protein
LTYVTRDDQLHLVDAFPEIKVISIGGPVYTTNIVTRVRNLNFYQIAKVVRKFLNDAYATDMAFYQQNALSLSADFLICDAFNDPCIDTAVALKKPFAITCTGILHQDISVPYMNSLGTTHHATSEHMTLWERFHHKYVDLIKILFHLYPELKELDHHRQQFGMEALGLNRFKQWDNAIKLINSYFGITPSQVLGPLTHMVGPVMSSQQMSLNEQERVFLDSHQRVAYVAFGQVVIPHQNKITLLLSALLDQMERNQLDGVIWVGLEQQVSAFEQENPSMTWTLNTSSSTRTFKAPLFSNALSKDIFMPSWAAQFAVLQHPSTVLFVSHGGASSANEATFSGVPILVLPYNGDQSLVGHALSLAGVARMYDSAESNFELIKSQMDQLLFDKDGSVARNLTRMQTLAQIGSKKKSFAADLIGKLTCISTKLSTKQ